MSEKIVQLNEEVIKGQLKELVRGSVEAVSYTHLLTLIHAIASPQYTHRRLVSVSYTHLDVYKRQV